MKIIDRPCFDEYIQLIGNDLQQRVEKFLFTKQNYDLRYQIQASAVYSSNIEGNTIDINSFMNYKQFKTKAKPQKDLQEIEDLILAYDFAQENLPAENNLLKAHKILSKQFVITGLRGKYRIDKVGIFGQSGLVYLAVEADYIATIMKSFFEEITALLAVSLSLEEVFYFASLIHLRFVHIHPFSDGNGRAARLLEKWFLAQKLGASFWNVPSERYYKEHQAEYYKNINLGVNFYELDYSKCLPFLLMLPGCLA